MQDKVKSSMDEPSSNNKVSKYDIFAALLANAYYTRLLIAQNSKEKYMDSSVQAQLKKEVFSTYCDFIPYAENLENPAIYDD